MTMRCHFIALYRSVEVGRERAEPWRGIRSGVEHIESDEQDPAAAARGLGAQVLGEARPAEQAERSCTSIVPSRDQQVADVLKPAQLGQARPAVTVLGLANERDRRARGSRPTSPPEGQDV